MSWEKVGLPKKEGGLGLKRIKDWKKGAIMKLIWNLSLKLAHYGLHGCSSAFLREDAFGQAKFSKILLGGWRLSDARHFK